MTVKRSSLEALLDTGEPVGGIDTFAMPGQATAPGYAPPGNVNTFNFRQGQMSPANQLAVNQSYQQGGLVTPMGPQMSQPSAPSAGVQDVKGEVERLRQQNPEVIQQIQQVMMQALQSGELTMQELNMAVQLATAAMQNPQMWPRLRQLAIQQGLGDEEDIPMQYDQGLATAIIIAGEAVQGMQVGAPAAAGQPPQASMKMGGEVPDSKNTDGSIPITAHEGEFVVPAEVVKAKGTEFFERMIAQVKEKGSGTTG